MKKNNLAIGIFILCLLCLLTGMFNSSQKVATENKNKEVKNITTSFSQNKIVLLKFNGVISSEDDSNIFSTATTAQNLIDALREIQKDDSAKGVIIKLNTPGGTVATSQNLYDAIIKTRNLKPVVIAMDDVAASGGYYISSAADRIFAQRGTLTGSIGVIFSTMDIHQLLSEKLAIKSNVIKSGKFKDIGSELKPMSDDERKLLQGIIDDSYNQFISDITKGRIKPDNTNSLQPEIQNVIKKLTKDEKVVTGKINVINISNNKVNGNFVYTSVPRKTLTEETLKKYADGRIFTGTQAYQLGFVDGIGDINVAHEAAVKMAKERFKLNDETIPLVPYIKYQNWSSYIFSTMSNLFGKKTETQMFDNLLPKSMKMARQPLYLWE